MSGTGETAIQVIMKPVNGKASKTGTEGVALTGGGAIDFPTRNRPSPSVDYFKRARAERKKDKRYVPYPR